MHFIKEGCVAIGYRIYNECFYSKVLKRRSTFGDYYCVTNKTSEFLFTSFQNDTQTYAIRKKTIQDIVEDHPELGAKYRANVFYNYKGIIRQPLNEHRDE